MIRTVPIAKVAKLNPSPPRELFDDPQREVSFVPMAQVGEDGRLHNGEARPVGELAQGYTYFADGDVIVAKITPCLQNGKAALVEGLRGGHGFGSTEFHVLRPGPALHGRYLFYMIWSPTFRHFGEQRFTGSAGQKRMPASAVAEFEIPLPFPDDPQRSLAEQKRIAAILDKADAIRRRRQEATRLADQLIPSVFYEMFGDPGTNVRRLLTTTVGELTRVLTGATPRRDVPSNFGGTIPWVKTTEVVDDVITGTEECLSDQGLRESRCELYPVGSIVIALYGQGATRGRTALLGIEATTNQACAILPPSTRYITSCLWTQIRMSYSRLRNAARGGNQPNLNLQIIRSFSVLDPPLARQRDFDKFFQHHQHAINRLRQSAGESQSLFNSLVQRAFRGEL